MQTRGRSDALVTDDEQRWDEWARAHCGRENVRKLEAGEEQEERELKTSIFAWVRVARCAKVFVSSIDSPLEAWVRTRADPCRVAQATTGDMCANCTVCQNAACACTCATRCAPVCGKSLEAGTLPYYYRLLQSYGSCSLRLLGLLLAAMPFLLRPLC